MVDVPLPLRDQLGRRFLALPRELRDLIYPYIVFQVSPLELTNCDIQAPVDHPVLSAEWLEAIYANRTCSIAFSNFRLLRDLQLEHSLWGSVPQHKRYIRHLIVNASEAVLREDDLNKVERECTVQKPEVRKEWNELLELPRLESLTIDLQKWSSSGFAWANFSPILYLLRERNPRLRISFNISFDAILENKWNIDLSLSEERREWVTRNVVDDPYLPMGFVDMSELIGTPTDEDRAYVGEYLSGTKDVGSMDIVRGLLDETPANRRVLTQHYLVKEPALLRVLMAEHYEIYKQVRRRNEATTEEEDGK
ncbi:hypothetical protein CC86DRAFT_464851 [Ophiobolus disseminans]|uniref:Uncharacterized protein n=1 Tax=Ophiobolus disseminans TaxID=1469910 RepID=A0A6A7A8Q7_9PLEO|nr:hypothetical protein CC86DRAFT_464851 [Ophiobolus disseminans]